MKMVSRGIRLGLVQFAAGTNKNETLQKTANLVKQAATEGKANIITLPECFNTPYDVGLFRDYAENLNTSKTCALLSSLAKEYEVYLIGGSIPELDENGSDVYNTCTIWDPTGQLIGKHRKVHLFDINIPGKITFKESSIFSPGSSFTTINAFEGKCKIGIGICYDIRFAEMAQFYRKQGCHLLVYPGAFNMTTGPAHWKLLQQGRAIDNQLYVATASPARDESASYKAWGHSMVVDPWGKVLAEADHTESIVYADLDLNYIEEVRESIPIYKQRRDELYKL